MPYKKVGTHIMGGVELQINWDKISNHNQYHELFEKGEDKTSVAAYNEHSDIYNQYSGTVMSTFGSMPGYATSRKDATGLGGVVVMDGARQRFQKDEIHHYL